MVCCMHENKRGLFIPDIVDDPSEQATRKNERTSGVLLFKLEGFELSNWIFTGLLVNPDN